MLVANFAEVAEALAGIALNTASRTRIRVDRDTLTLLTRTSRPRCPSTDSRTGAYAVRVTSRLGAVELHLANLFRTTAACARRLCRDSRDLLRRQLSLKGFDSGAWRLVLEAEEA